MSRKLPYANTIPHIELGLMKNIHQAKQFAYATGHSRRKTAAPLTDEQRAEIPCYRRKPEHYPLYKVPASKAVTIEQRLQQAGLANDIRPGDTYRARIRNYKFKRGEFSYLKEVLNDE